MSMSVLLVNDEDVPADIKALLKSKIPQLSIHQILPEHLFDSEEMSFGQAKYQHDLYLARNSRTYKALEEKGLTALCWKKHSDLSSKIDVFLQLRRCQAQFPINIKGWTLKEVIHNSQDCIIYLAVNEYGVFSAVKRFKFKPNDLSREMIHEFLQRLETQCSIRSKGLVHFYDGGICNNAFYLVMEYLSYGTLRQNLNSCNQTLPEVHALEWFGEIAQALDHVHKAGLIHRDLKIENIMLRADGSLALTDYGVSKHILLDAGFIREDEIHCSPHYVSPELISGEVCTSASDIYSLGVIFYELLTGEKPYSGREAYELMMQHVMAPVPVLQDSLKKYQPVLNKMMAKCPADRYSRPLEAIVDLERIALRSNKTPPDF